MTPAAQQPQREYIINEMLLKRMTAIMYQDCEPDTDIVDSLIAEVHSRQHPPAPETISKELALELCVEQCQIAARAATLATLEDVWKECNQIKRYEHTDSDDMEYTRGQRIIELCGATDSIHSVLMKLWKQEQHP
jgi:hypothetical protein